MNTNPYENINILLKNAIIAKVQDNLDEFQLATFMKKEFAEYIYGKDGNHLMGGEAVSDFIDDVIRLFAR